MASGKFGAEHGLSYLIEHNGFRLLFDTGHSDLFVRNAKLLNIDLNKIETVVLSHGHWDHGNGLRFLQNKKLICHPGVFIKRFRKGGVEHIGLEMEKKQIANRYEVHTYSSPVNLSPEIVFLGEIPRNINFEKHPTPYIDANGKPDTIPDDSALMIIDNGELVIISGCAHSGICNIIDYAQKISGIKKVKAVVGGFHLKNDDHRLEETIKYFSKLKVQYLYPSHCTALPALSKFYYYFGIEQLKAGMVLEIN
ncbi:MAG: MBL fold metallo-hydrolase [Bacteroidota bacterium]|nr:MBL fold metallo-hydrolase [Bacteroidota bacterium]